MRTKKSFSIDSVLVCMFSIMPIIDSLNGFSSVQIIGPVYRLFVMMVLLLISIKKRSNTTFLIVISCICVFQLVNNIDVWLSNLQGFFKLLVPLLMLSICQEDDKYFSASDMNIILNVWSLLYPILILLPFLLGGDVASYSGGIGSKGFFIATNEVSFVVTVVFICNFILLLQNGYLVPFLFFSLNGITLLMIGTKSGIMVLAVMIVWCIFRLIIDSRRYRFTFRSSVAWLFIFGLMMSCFFVVVPYLGNFIKRWKWLFENGSNSLLDFLTSNRTRRIGQGFKDFSRNWWYPLIGWGFGGENVGLANCEMDFIDLLFRTGIIGFVSILLMYFTYVYDCLKFSVRNIVILSIVFIVIFFMGDVLFYGASGMALGYLLIFLRRFPTFDADRGYFRCEGEI